MLTFTPKENTSITKVKHVSLQHPSSFRLCGDGILCAPRSVILDGIVSYGGSTGSGLHLIQKAFGEYYERNHFFTSVPITSQKKLSQIRPKSHQTQLKSLCRLQDNLLNDHFFSLTTVQNIFTEQPFNYFYNAISLKSIKEDSKWLFVTDSCGCASHITKEAALLSSVTEFIERQALIGSWLSKRYRYSINPDVLDSLTPYSTLYQKMSESGEFYLYELGHHLGGYTVVMFYFSKSKKDVVQYATGCKTSTSLAMAVSGAFEELYQCYTFLYSTAFKTTNLGDKAGSGYHQEFISYNNQNTRSLIPFLDKRTEFDIQTVEEVYAFSKTNYEGLLASLKEISSELFYYHFYEKSLKLHFVKIFSPDFFSHMSLNQDLNINNVFAKKMGITKENAYLHRLPFP